jgi:hypothetical protein
MKLVISSPFLGDGGIDERQQRAAELASSATRRRAPDLRSRARREHADDPDRIVSLNSSSRK